MILTRLRALLGILARPERKRRSWRQRLDLTLAAAPWLIVAGLLEFLGRSSPHELIDAIGVAILLAASFLCLLRTEVHWRIPWESRWRQRWYALTTEWRPENGLDLRGEPPLPGRLPKRACDLLFVALGVVTILALTRTSWPTDARLAIRQISGLAWLAFIGGLWFALFAGAAGACVGLLEHFVSPFLKNRSSESARTLRRASALTLLLTVGLLATLLPRGIALVFLGGAWLAFVLCLLVTMRKLRYVWRTGDGPLSSASVGVWEAGGVTMLVLVAFALALAAGGERLFIAGPPETGLTAWLGAAFAWAVALGLGGTLLVQVFRFVQAASRGPVRERRVPVHVSGALGRTRSTVQNGLRAAGFRTSFAERAPSRGVTLRFQDGADALFDPWSSVWPRLIAAGDLANPVLHESLRLRRRIQLRREIRLGFERLLRAIPSARGDRAQESSGIWLALHLWFVTHATRDAGENPDEEEPVGPAVWTLMSREARGHLAGTLEELELDSLFLEDGVGERRFARVLTLLFETHDRLGAHRFAGLHGASSVPGVRLIVHDLSPDSPFRSRTYPEPETGNLSRARVLHVFRDRGDDGDAELTEEPRSWVGRGAPVLI